MDLVRYAHDLTGVSGESLDGFFVGWPVPPTLDRRYAMLRGSSEVIIAWDVPSGKLIGFISALTDGQMCAFIPLLEVLPEYQGRGIGSELVRRMMRRLEQFYSVDIVCDANLCKFYEKLGFFQCHSMIQRRRETLIGSNAPVRDRG